MLLDDARPPGRPAARPPAARPPGRPVRAARVWAVVAAWWDQLGDTRPGRAHAGSDVR
jgi:hypothetical protein